MKKTRLALPLALLISLPVSFSVSLSAAAPLHAQKLKIDPNAAKAPQSLEDRKKALDQVFKDYWEDVLRHSPETASSLGDKRYNDQISDYSVRAYNAGLEREQGFLLRLAAIDNTGFTAQENISRDLLLRQITDDQEGSEFKEWEFQINQMGGIHTTYPELVPQLSFTTVKDYDDWISRLHAIPKAFSQATEDMSIGVQDHRVPPKYLLEKALDQVKEFAHQKPEDSPFAEPLKKFPASISAGEQTRIRQEMLDAIGKEVLPAYLRLQRFMEVTYVPAGREEPGISALPDGAKYYAFSLRRTTTTNLTAEQIHKIGEDEVAKDEAEMLVIARKLGFADLKSFEADVKTNPKLKPTSREQILDAYRGYLGPMQAKLPQLFGRLPKAGFEVAPVPEYVEKNSSDAYYEAGTPDGSRPGRIRVNTYNPTGRCLCDVESIAYHEGLPGHHLQISIAQELEGVPDFRKFGGYTAFSEGWGLYAERLGKDIGFYQDPYEDYGRLQGDIWRAIRLVVDTGVHAQHWTRQQMVDYFHDHSAINETSVQSEVDRYIAWPSQAVAYKIGQLKILELRDRAKKALGDKFDIRAFHDQVLDSGALPLDVLDQRINDWIATQK
ncbi:MAG TPA: DUF885 domain-containing protein [Acidobacteriaceae bacterium]|nr:DUF885 domain-containing protein [Acidobacteriaceae bacterium]